MNNNDNVNNNQNDENSLLKNLYIERQFLINQLKTEEKLMLENKANSSFHINNMNSLRSSIAKINEKIIFLEDLLINGINSENSSLNLSTIDYVKMYESIYGRQTEKKLKVPAFKKNQFSQSATSTDVQRATSQNTYCPQMGSINKKGLMKISSQPTRRNKSQNTSNEKENVDDGLSM